MSSAKPDLSIITAVYQGRQYIASCIESVINQKYDSVEHIIVDGVSTDGTVDIVKSYLQKYPHIRFISEKDKGQSDALNKGIKLAQSKIIGILNVDDFYEPDVFRQINAYFLQLKEPALLVGNCNVLGFNDQINNINKPKRLRQEELLLGVDINPYPVNPSAYFYHRSLHDEIGYYDENEDYSMDLKFILKAVAVAHVLYVDKCWGNFRYVPGTKTYEDANRGGLDKRVHLIFESFLNKLPLYKRWWVRSLRYRKTGYFYYRIGYYLENPVPRIWNTLKNYYS
jgi:glycosyltransferase involved in cell wall biosynthesis